MRRCRRLGLDPSPGVHDNPGVGLAEFVVLLLVAAVCYAALAPLRTRIERRWLKLRRQHRGATVIPLVRGGDGIYARGKDTSHGDER